MTLSPGSRLGPYEIVAPIGAGGMGEVYRARDPRLGRDVAIKVLPAEVANDADRLRRFEQEARAASALNHSNILTIHDVGTHEKTTFLVFELLSGESVRESLRKGPLPEKKAIEIALQIARGLAAAHERGILHRDLKPENLFVTSDGVSKILDFGLAKMSSLRGKGEDASAASTLLETAVGTMHGTAGYMAPEQVRGEPADARSDIFSFGVTLYEMVAGVAPFHGRTAADRHGAILKDLPEPLGRRCPGIRPEMERLVMKCLEKDPGDRYQHADDIVVDLRRLARIEPPGRPSITGSGARSLRPVAALGIALVALAAGAMLGQLLWRAEQGDTAPVRVNRITEFIGIEEYPAISPDGRSVAFTAQVDGIRQLWVKLLSGGPALQVTRDPVDHLYPRWSRDSASLIYFTPPAEGEPMGSIGQVAALGGPPRRLLSSLSGADMRGTDDRMAFFRLASGRIELVAATRDGSDPVVMAGLEPGYAYQAPRWSPDGRILAYQRKRMAKAEVFVLRDDDANPRKLPDVFSEISGFTWLPDSSGLLFSSSWGSIMMYQRAFQLWTLRLDEQRPRRLTFGEASYTNPDLDRAGTLVASRMRLKSDLWRIPVDGGALENVQRATPITRQTGEVRTPSASPDGREIVYVSDAGGHSNLWVVTPGTGESRQLTFERAPSLRIGVPVWSPDGGQIAFYWAAEDESESGYSLIQPDGSNLRRLGPMAWLCWSPDSRWVYFQEENTAERHLKKRAVEGGPSLVVRTENASRPALSPDGNTLYFVVEEILESGALEIEVRSANPEDGPSHRIARLPAHRIPDSGRFHPVISPDGRWLALALTDGVTSSIWTISTADGSLRQITDFGHRPTIITRKFAWAPDGLSIYAAISEGDADIVSLEGLLGSQE